MKQIKVMTIIGWIFTALIGCALLASAALKIAQPEFVTEGFAKSGFPDGTLVPIGIAELISALPFLFPTTRVLGAILVTGYMGGAIATHVHAGEPIGVDGHRRRISAGGGGGGPGTGGAGGPTGGRAHRPGRGGRRSTSPRADSRRPSG